MTIKDDFELQQAEQELANLQNQPQGPNAMRIIELQEAIALYRMSK